MNQFAANSRHFPRTEKTGVAAGIYDLRRLTAAKNQALRRAHCGGLFVSGCYRPIAPNIQATSFAVKLPFSGIIGIIGIIGIAKILSLFFCGFQDSGILTSKPRRAPFVCKILIINTFTIILTYQGRFRECRPAFHPIATPYLLKQLTINNLQKQGCFWVLSEAPKHRGNFDNSLIVNNLTKHQLDMG